MEKIYHYTSPEGMFSILQNNDHIGVRPYERQIKKFN